MMSTPSLRSVRDLDVAGKRVLVRLDLNVPLRDGAIADDTRIRAALPTLLHLRERGARLVVCSHLGRPKGRRNDAYSLLPVAERLSELMDADVVFAHTTCGTEVTDLVKEQDDDVVVVTENLRFQIDEVNNEVDFGRDLASLAEVFVNDAFGVLHRSHASVVGVTKYLPSAAGLLVEEELKALAPFRAEPGATNAPAAAIVGGAKVSDKIAVLSALSQGVDELFIGGAMAYTFLQAQGQPVGASRVEADWVASASELLASCAARDVRVHLPVDHVVATRFAEDAEASVVDTIEEGQMGLDIGPKTVSAWSERLAGCKSVFWNGPMGVFEWEAFSAGTRGIAKALAGSSAYTVVGGGDSAAAIATFGHADDVSHVCTGGGAALSYIETGDLPGLVPLMESA